VGNPATGRKWRDPSEQRCSVVRFITYSVALLASSADGFAEFTTWAEIAAQFPLSSWSFYGPAVRTRRAPNSQAV
jgi:hypothetical protein